MKYSSTLTLFAASLTILHPARATAAESKSVKLAKAQTLSVSQTGLAGPLTLNVSQIGNDRLAVRGGKMAFFSLKAALASAQAGDTVHLAAGVFRCPGALTCTQSIYLVGEGVSATTLVPDLTTTMRFTAAVQIRNLNFDTGADATGGNANAPLIDLSGASGDTVADCRFHGINTICLNGNALKNSAFVNLTFDHVYLPIFVDSSPGNYPAALSFNNCNANHVIAGGFIIHAPDAYFDTDAQGDGVDHTSGLDFLNCSVKDTPNALGFEVWHGWSNIHFTRCAAEDCAYGFSVSNCDNATLTSCTSNNCYYLYENAASHDVLFVGCTADWRPTATSPYVGNGLPFGTAVVACNGPSHDVQWAGGAILGASFHTFTGHDIKLLNADLPGATVRIQNSSSVTVQGCHFWPLAGSPTAANWVTIDCGMSNLSNIVFDGNECDGALPYACMEIYGTPNAIDGLQITGNHTDGFYNYAGGFVHDQGVTLTNHYFSGNTTDNPNTLYPTNTCFPNDPY